MKIKNLEGSVFAVPLLNREYCALGLVARHCKHSTLFYFFNKRYDNRINKIPIDDIKRDNVLWITLAGDGAFAKSAWPILGILKDWNKDEWNVPIFKTKDVLRGFPVAVFYDEKLEEIDRKKITEEEANKIKWKNGIAGTGFIEEELSDLL